MAGWARILILFLSLLVCLQLATARTPAIQRHELVRRQGGGENPPAPSPSETAAPPPGETPSPSATDGESSTVSTTASATSSVPTLTNGDDGSINPNSSNFNATIPPDVLPIEPKITPGWAVAGVVLLITGVVHAVTGTRNAWVQTFFSTAYLASLATTVLIVYVMPVPVSNAVQGGYVTAIILVGIILGIAATFFKEITEGFGCMLGGFCISMWILSLRSGGMLPQLAPRVIFIAAVTLVSFGLYFSRHTRVYASIILISFAGSTAFVLGIDAFSRAGWKEFWVYIWALNDDLFPLGTVTYPVTKGIRVELAVTIVMCIFGIISQLKLWQVIQKRRQARAAERAEGERQLQEEEAAVGRQVEEATDRDRRAWERVYGNGAGVFTSGDSGLGDAESTKRLRHNSNGSSTIEMNEIPPLDRTSFEPSRDRSSLNKPTPGIPGAEHSRGDVGEFSEDIPLDLVFPSVPPDVPPKSPPPALPFERGKDGMVTVRVQREEYPHTSSALTAERLRDPEEEAWLRGASTNSLPISQRRSLRGPEVVPLPFKIAEDTDTHDEQDRRTLGERSSVATYAEDDDEGNKRNSLRRRLSQGSAHLLRSLSQRTTKTLPTEKGEDEEGLEGLVAHKKANWENDSIAANADAESLDGDRSTIRDEAPRRSIEITAELGDGSAAENKGKHVDGDIDTTPLSVGDAEAAATRTTSEAGKADGATEGTNGHSSTADRKSAHWNQKALPDALSRTAMKYRTNEWVKHSSSADTPDPDALKLADYPEEDTPAPLDVEELQRTAENGAPRPAPTRAESAMSNYGGVMSRNDSRLSAHGKPLNIPAHVMQGSGGRDSPLAESPTRSSSGAGYRSTSALHTQPIAEEGSEFNFVRGDSGSSGPNSTSPSPLPEQGPRFANGLPYSSTQTLIAQREALLHSRAQGAYPQNGMPGFPSMPSMRPTSGMDAYPVYQRAASDAGSVYDFSRPISPDDDMPLSQRRAIIRQSSMLGMSTSSLGPQAAAGAHPAETSAFNSHQPLRRPAIDNPLIREAKLANFRQSVAADLRSGTPVYPQGLNGRETPFANMFGNGSTSLLPGPAISGQAIVEQGLEYRRSQMMREKEAVAERKEKMRVEKEASEKMREEMMRSSVNLMDAHRETMRRLQGAAREH